MKLRHHIYSLFTLILPVQALAAPVVTSIGGTFQNGDTVQIIGAAFGAKSPAPPYLFADFESGLSPSSLGIVRSWDQVQAMMASSEGANGTKGAKTSDGSGVWSLRVDYNSWSRESQPVYIYKKERMNFLITDNSQNWKTLRIWPEGLGYPNLYTASNNGRVFVENIGTESGFFGSFKVTTTNWVTQEVIMKASSAINRKDGVFILRYDGQEKANGSILTRSSSASTYMGSAFVFHGVAANHSSWSPSWNDNNRMWVDDLYVDTSWARVMLGNAASFNSCTRLEIQIPTAWADNMVTVRARPGGFPSQSNVYVYVFDKDGNVNSNGYPVRIGTNNLPLQPEPDVPLPIVNAGRDQAIPMKTSVELDGNVQLPSGVSGQVQSQWAMVSGPGVVTFEDSSRLETTANFVNPGEYTLRLTAATAEATSADEVKISVLATGPEDQIWTSSGKNLFNPARGEAYIISYNLVEAGSLAVRIYDTGGQLIRALSGGAVSPGFHTVIWDGRNEQGSIVASGIYVVEKELAGRRVRDKVAVMK